MYMLYTLLKKVKEHHIRALWEKNNLFWGGGVSVVIWTGNVLRMKDGSQIWTWQRQMDRRIMSPWSFIGFRLGQCGNLSISSGAIFIFLPV